MNRESEISIFCENVKQLRAINKLSKKEMAKKLGIGIQSLSMIENGILPPRLGCGIIFRIHHNFGIIPKNMFIPFEKT